MFILLLRDSMIEFIKPFFLLPAFRIPLECFCNVAAGTISFWEAEVAG